MTSPSHCGACDAPCASAVCECAPGYTLCADNCVNLLTDKYNCMSCGNVCTGNRTCKNGACG